MRKNQLTHSGIRLLRAIHVLKLSDLTILAPLLCREGFRFNSLRSQLARFANRGLIYSIPLNYRRWTQPNVYVLSPLGAQLLGRPDVESHECERRKLNIERLNRSTKVSHELGISTVHAALLRGQSEGVLQLSEWIQGDTEMKFREDTMRPDFLCSINGGAWLAGELDTGSERLVKDKHHGRNSIEHKITTYGRLNSSKTYEHFRVLFVVANLTSRETNHERMEGILQLAKERGRVHDLNKGDFYQVAMLTNFTRGLAHPSTLIEPFIHAAGLARPITLLPARATVEAEAARQVSP